MSMSSYYQWPPPYIIIISIKTDILNLSPELFPTYFGW